MGGKDARTREDELWGSVYSRLVPWTARRHRVNSADAEEMVQESIRLFLRAGGIANPDDPRALLAALGSGINGVAVGRRRKKAILAVSVTKDGAPAEPSKPEHPADRIERVDEARKGVGTLLGRIQEDALSVEIVLQMADGVLEPAEQAKALGRDVREVYNARRRLKVHVEAVEKIMEKW